MKISCDGVRRTPNVRQRREVSEMGKMMRWDVIKILITWNWSCRCRRRRLRRHHHRELLPLTLHGHPDLWPNVQCVCSFVQRKNTAIFSFRRSERSKLFILLVVILQYLRVNGNDLYSIFLLLFCVRFFNRKKCRFFSFSTLWLIQFSNFNRNLASRIANENCSVLENKIEEWQC